VSEISFKLPIEVGELLDLRSRVLFYSDLPPSHEHYDTHTQADLAQHLMAVEVVASVLIPEDATSRVTNTFRFLFADAIAKDTRKSVARVLPSTTGEAKLCAEALLRAGLPLVLD